MEAGTITCPNCGANTTNHQNCEYCGSLLVQVADKEFGQSYIEYSKNYNDEKLLSVVSKYFSITKKLRHISPQFKVYSGNQYLFRLSASAADGQFGAFLILDRNDMNPIRDKFFRANVGKIFTPFGGGAIMKFGFDANGTTQIIKQLLLDVYNVKEEDISYKIEFVGTEHFADYNSQGILVRGGGFGLNEFSDEEAVNALSKQEGVKEWLPFVLWPAGIILLTVIILAICFSIL